MRIRKFLSGDSACGRRAAGVNVLLCLGFFLLVNLPPGFQAIAEETKDQSLLTRAYALRDKALNEQMVGDYGLAADHMDQAIRLAKQHWSSAKPLMAEYYFDLGRCRELAGQIDPAVAAFKNCLAMMPNHTSARVHLARLLFKADKLDEAIQQARRAVRSDPQSSEAKLILSLLLKKVNPGDPVVKRLEQEALSVNKPMVLDKEASDIEKRKQELARQKAEEARKAAEAKRAEAEAAEQSGKNPNNEETEAKSLTGGQDQPAAGTQADGKETGADQTGSGDDTYQGLP